MEKIKTIGVQDMMSTLAYLHSIGVDYVDITGQIIKGEDSVIFSFSKEYLSPKHRDSFEEDMKENGYDVEEGETENIKIKPTLTDNDIDEIS